MGGVWVKLHSIGFSVALGVAALTLYIGARIFHLLMDKRSAEKASLTLFRTVWQILTFCTPGLKLRGVPTAQEWKNTVPLLSPKPGDKKRGYLVMVNHTSQLDGFLFSVLSPVKLFANCRTLMKSSLFNVPVAGALFEMIGCLPVFFLRGDTGSFSVDRDKQAPVTAKLKRHFEEEGGILSFCPEGAINKGDPKIVADFRRGTFQMAIDFRLPIYGVSSFGNHLFWPNAGGLPGRPCTIDNQLFAVEEWNKALQEAGDDKPISLTAAELSDMCRTRMQSSVDVIVARQDADLKGGKGQ